VVDTHLRLSTKDLIKLLNINRLIFKKNIQPLDEVDIFDLTVHAYT